MGRHCSSASIDSLTKAASEVGGEFLEGLPQNVNLPKVLLHDGGMIQSIASLAVAADPGV